MRKPNIRFWRTSVNTSIHLNTAKIVVAVVAFKRSLKLINLWQKWQNLPTSKHGKTTHLSTIARHHGIAFLVRLCLSNETWRPSEMVIILPWSLNKMPKYCYNHIVLILSPPFLLPIRVRRVPLQLLPSGLHVASSEVCRVHWFRLVSSSKYPALTRCCFFRLIYSWFYFFDLWFHFSALRVGQKWVNTKEAMTISWW